MPASLFPAQLFENRILRIITTQHSTKRRHFRPSYLLITTKQNKKTRETPFPSLFVQAFQVARPAFASPALAFPTIPRAPKSWPVLLPPAIQTSTKLGFTFRRLASTIV
jgi:hypothetical protein